MDESLAPKKLKLAGITNGSARKATFKKRKKGIMNKKMVKQESFLRQRIAKANMQLKKQREREGVDTSDVSFRSVKVSLQHLNMMDLNDLGSVVEPLVFDMNMEKMQTQ
ncbi:hypothetical protein K2173_000883 [Erythroxylum novogranatense]|uniref:MADS-box domain-containing protein n=1 Tax=Erythroxylum novogranatense TaxID=1862640 RepID=A0AAV8TR01_9ROSI|nr:hypothetical protein K2173_000883 [Erythroxylum novogranatense]